MAVSDGGESGIVSQSYLNDFSALRRNFPVLVEIIQVLTSDKFYEEMLKLLFEKGKFLA